MIPDATIWELVDLAAAMLIILNVPALILLSKYVRYALRDYDLDVKVKLINFKQSASKRE